MGGLTLGIGETVESGSWITQFLPPQLLQHIKKKEFLHKIQHEPTSFVLNALSKEQGDADLQWISSPPPQVFLFLEANVPLFAIMTQNRSFPNSNPGRVNGPGHRKVLNHAYLYCGILRRTCIRL